MAEAVGNVPSMGVHEGVNGRAPRCRVNRSTVTVTAQHSTAQDSTAQHSTGQGDCSSSSGSSSRSQTWGIRGNVDILCYSQKGSI